LDVYGCAWEQGDVEAVRSLFAPDAAYYEIPFDPPMVGLDAITAYWQEGAASAQKDVRFSHRILGVSGDLGLHQ
jgi:ketosteroid isomerase-like protein